MNNVRLNNCARTFLFLSAFIGVITAKADQVITLPPIEVRASDGVYTIPVFIHIDSGSAMHVTFAAATSTGGTFVGIDQTDPYILDRIARTKACQQAVTDYVTAKTDLMSGELQQVHSYLDNYQSELGTMWRDVGQMVQKVYERYAPGPVAAQLCAAVATASIQAANETQGGFMYLAHQAENTAYAGRLLNLSLWQGQANQSCADNQQFDTFTG